MPPRSARHAAQERRGLSCQGQTQNAERCSSLHATSNRNTGAELDSKVVLQQGAACRSTGCAPDQLAMDRVQCTSYLYVQCLSWVESAVHRPCAPCSTSWAESAADPIQMYSTQLS
eukprot:365516-Chlamydomonas_euryale.AAC.11